MIHPPPVLWFGSSSLNSLTSRDGVLRLLGVSPDRGVSEDAQEQQRSHPLPVTREHVYLHTQERVRAQKRYFNSRAHALETAPHSNACSLNTSPNLAHNTVNIYYVQ